MITSEHVAMAKRAAHSYRRKLPDVVDVDDLAQTALIAIWEGLKVFDEARGVALDKFLAHKMRFAMQDALREGDWMPREARQLDTRIRKATQRLEHENGGPARAGQVAAACGLTLDELRAHERDVIWPESEDWTAIGPCDEAEADEVFAAIDAAYDRLDARSRRVVDGVTEGRTGDDIGAELGVHKARVSQLWTAALAKLRKASGL